MKLYLEESAWSGWSDDYKPEIKKFEYELVKGVKNVVTIMHISYIKDGVFIEEDEEACSFVIEDIHDDYIVINVNGSMFNENNEEIKIEKEKVIEIVTPTMDFGYIYKFELK